MSFVHANDAAMGDLGYERKKADFYPTPPWVTEAVLPSLFGPAYDITRNTRVWEPACGMGDIVLVLRNHFNAVEASDLHDYGFRPSIFDIDFLKTSVHTPGLIITNPPYGDIAEDFIRHALKSTERFGGTVAMLLRNEYDCAKGRVDLFTAESPFSQKVVLTSRPRWIEGSTGAPRHNYAWFIWSWAHVGMDPIVTYHVKQGK